MKSLTATLLLTFGLIGSAPLPAETVAPVPPKIVITDASRWLSPEDLKAIVATAGTYLEGDEQIFSIDALTKDAVRVNIGIIKSPAWAHGMKFTLHRSASGWTEDRRDKSEVWNGPRP